MCAAEGGYETICGGIRGLGASHHTCGSCQLQQQGTAHSASSCASGEAGDTDRFSGANYEPGKASLSFIIVSANGRPLLEKSCPSTVKPINFIIVEVGYYIMTKLLKRFGNGMADH